MLRRATLVFFVVLFCAVTASPKFKPDEQAYLDNQFRALIEQIQALKKQNDALSAEITTLRQDQAQFQAVIVRQQRKLEDVEQLVSSVRIGNEDNFSKVKDAITKLGEQQEKSFKDLIGSTTEAATAAPVATTTTGRASSAIRGYVTAVKGEDITLDLGSSQGLQAGTRLQMFKATDLNTPVGEIEVTEVIDASTSHARVVSLNPGVKAEFSDVVRPE